MKGLNSGGSTSTHVVRLGIAVPNPGSELMVFVEDTEIDGRQPYYYASDPIEAIVKLIEYGNALHFKAGVRVILSKDKLTRLLWEEYYLGKDIGIRSAIQYE
jgi:hypothetical protein